MKIFDRWQRRRIAELEDELARLKEKAGIQQSLLIERVASTPTPDELRQAACGVDVKLAGLRRQVAEMPRIRFVCGRDWLTGQHDYAIGFLWDRNFDARPGTFIYQKRILLRLMFRLSIEKWL